MSAISHTSTRTFSLSIIRRQYVFEKLFTFYHYFFEKKAFWRGIMHQSLSHWWDTYPTSTLKRRELYLVYCFWRVQSLVSYCLDRNIMAWWNKATQYVVVRREGKEEQQQIRISYAHPTRYHLLTKYSAMNVTELIRTALFKLTVKTTCHKRHNKSEHGNVFHLLCWQEPKDNS